jgi:DNA-binding PucR family transcriptional regulator
LGRVLDHLGTTVLDLAAGETSTAREVSGVVIYDRLDEPQLPPGALVLGVGLGDPGEIAAVIDELGRNGAAGLVVRAPVPDDDAIRMAVGRSGIVVLGLVRGASWSQLAGLLRGLLADGDVGAGGESDTIAGLPAGDLFAVANAVSSLIDAPVTIEDRSSRLLAFSGGQDEADPSRVQTILGRQVPDRYTRRLEEIGAFRNLYYSQRPVFIDIGLPDEIQRMAVAVRAGDEILGSIWAAVHEPLSPAREQAIADAANVVALHLLRLRAGADVERRLRADLVATALEGGSGAPAALARLGLTEQPVVVLALTLPSIDGDGALSSARLEAERERAADALAVHLSAVHGGSAVALLGGVAYAILPILGDPAAGDARAARVAEEFLERTGGRALGLIGVGRVAYGVEALTRSRADADRVLRVLDHVPAARAGAEGQRVRPRVARLSDVHAEVLLLELAALASADGHEPSATMARLTAYDALHHTALVPTLRAWLDAFGDVIAAAASVHVHANTFRYRLRRIAEVGEIDLDDPDDRFAAMLQLRLLDAGGGA